eukprot:TRINITY_DN4654_c0_g1_i11.p1 TRINITY_DN4654_c0_g1~~TRINITY_DN4654_c0_g1_i11.p1  ORF type:complete len:375 (-),score=102.46 TRINITY_DN4654_c0_g1_i11:24-1148(-)
MPLNSELVELIKSRSQADWTNLDEFKKDLEVVVLCFLEAMKTPNHLISCLVGSFWLLFNATFCKQARANDLWKNFRDLLEQIAVSHPPHDCPPEESLRRVRDQLQTFFKSVAEKKPEVSQTAIDEVQDFTSEEERQMQLAVKYCSRAEELVPEFENLLKNLDRHFIVGSKSPQRAYDKAVKDYGGNVARVLDYLRGMIHVFVDETDTASDIAVRYGTVLKTLGNEIYRVKVFPEDESNRLPRVLVNFQFNDLIAEVQIHFRTPGVNDDYQVFLHTVYELVRKDVFRVNMKDHIIELILDMIHKTGLAVSDKLVKTNAQSVMIRAFTDQVTVDVQMPDGRVKSIEGVLLQETDKDGDALERYRLGVSKKTHYSTK